MPFFFPLLSYESPLWGTHPTPSMERKRSKTLQFCIGLLLQKSLLRRKVMKYSLAYCSGGIVTLLKSCSASQCVAGKFFCPSALKKGEKIRKEAGEMLVQYQFGHPVHVTIRGERKVVAEEGRGRWVSWGGWNERQSSPGKMQLILLGGLTGTES